MDSIMNKAWKSNCRVEHRTRLEAWKHEVWIAFYGSHKKTNNGRTPEGLAEVLHQTFMKHIRSRDVPKDPKHTYLMLSDRDVKRISDLQDHYYMILKEELDPGLWV